jgi:hypothetical protein
MLLPTEAVLDANHPMSSEVKILFHEYGTQLRLEEDDSLVLNVLCGRVFEYGVEFALNESERERYKADGDTFVKDLARRVLHDPESYAERGKKC